MQCLLIVANTAIYEHDGYRARISMEIELLKNYYKIILLIPEINGRKEDFGPVVKICYLKINSNTKNRILRKFLWGVALRRKVIELVEKTNCIVYCEGLIMSIALLFDIGKRYKFVFDCHGAEPEEVYLYHHNFMGKLKSIILKRIEYVVVNRSSGVVTVTQNQFARWQVKKKHVVLPMIPGEQFLVDNCDRVLKRKQMKIPEQAIVCVYSGNNQRWQMCEQTIELFSKLEMENPKLFLIVYTQAVAYFKMLLKKFKIKNAVVLCVNYDNMPSYLDVCDFGFCLRDNCIINHVASPTKVMEYLARNIKPILSKHVGDFSDTLGENNMAIIFDDGWEKLTPRVEFTTISNDEGRQYVVECKKKFSTSYLKMLESL